MSTNGQSLRRISGLDNFSKANGETTLWKQGASLFPFLPGFGLFVDPVARREGRIAVGGPVAELVGIEGGVVSGVINLESSGVEASDWRPRHDEPYHEV